MLTREEIESNSDQLTYSAREAWLLLFRGSIVYRDRAWAYPDLEARLDATVGTTQARMLNGLLALIEGLGPGEAVLVPGTSQGGVQYSQRLEREALITEAFGCLYDVAAMTVTLGSQDTIAASGIRSTFGPCCSACYGSHGERVYHSRCGCHGSYLIA